MDNQAVREYFDKSIYPRRPDDKPVRVWLESMRFGISPNLIGLDSTITRENEAGLDRLLELAQASSGIASGYSVAQILYEIRHRGANGRERI